MTPRSTLKPLITTVFVPSAVFGIGQGAGAPGIELIARDLGASVGIAGLIVSLVFGIGAAFDLLCSYPAGQLMDL